jgi:6,7-dimethyl-8-ribityllumazine synthase
VRVGFLLPYSEMASSFARHKFTFLIIFSLHIVACSDKSVNDPCCRYSAITDPTSANEDDGVLYVQGSTTAYYYVLNDQGEQVIHQVINKAVPLPEGEYNVRINNSLHAVRIRSEEQVNCLTGTLTVSGNTSDYYYVIDSTGQQLTYEMLGKQTSLFPGIYTIRVNETEVSTEVKLNEFREIRTGSILVEGTTNEYYYVLGTGNKQLNYNTLGKPLAFLPGFYEVKVNNTSMKADVVAGRVTTLATGNILVSGLTEEYYYVTDSVGNALNFQTLNKSIAVFPGDYEIKVNNTIVRGSVLAGQTSEFATGSLVLTGHGSGYYYVFDPLGNQLNYNTLNKSLSLFPSEYTVKLGGNTRKATVNAGQLTSVTTVD